MELSIKETFIKIHDLEMARRHGLMAHLMKETISMDRNKEQENLFGPISPAILATSLSIKRMAKESTLGQMEELTMVLGKETK